MMKLNSQEIVFDHGLPPKNKIIVGLLFLKFPLLIPGMKWLIKRYLKHCYKIDFIPGFLCYYGNIYAQNVFLGDTFFMDYAPIHIGENSKFSLQNIIITACHDHKDFSTIKAKPVVIGKNVWITTRCIILGGVRIGDNSVIGAGSVVTRDIPPNCLAGGNPAKVIRYFR